MDPDNGVDLNQADGCPQGWPMSFGQKARLKSKKTALGTCPGSWQINSNVVYHTETTLAEYFNQERPLSNCDATRYRKAIKAIYSITMFKARQRQGHFNQDHINLPASYLKIAKLITKLPPFYKTGLCSSKQSLESL